MAEKKIGLRIELNGFRGVITNMKQLEDEIRKAKEDLQELEIGGAMFNVLTKEISRAETELGKLRRTTEGLSVEKQVEGYGKLSAGIMGGFAAASAAMSLFGNESEEMSKAAVQAQNLITLALSARSLAELKTGASIVATTIATRAEAIATSLATKETWLMNTAMKGLFTTIAANPIGAMVAVLGLAITAMMAFGDETEKSVVDLKEINGNVESAAVSLRNYQKMANEAATGTDEHAFAIKQIKKEIPGFNALLDANGRITNEGNLYINNRIKLLGLQAKAQALANAQAKIETEIALNKTKPLEEQLTFFDKLEGYVGYLYFGEFGQQVSNATNAMENMSEADKKLQKELKAVEGLTKQVNTQMAQLEGEMAATNEKIKKQAELESKANQTKTDNNKATQAQIDNYNRLNKALNNIILGYAKETENLKELINISLKEVPEPKVLTDLKKLVDARNQLKPEVWQETLKSIGIGIEEVDGVVIKLTDNMTSLVDEVGKFYTGFADGEDEIKGFEDRVVDFFVEGKFTEVRQEITAANEQFKKFLAEGKINPNTYQSLVTLLDGYTRITDMADDLPTINQLFGAEEGIKLLSELDQSLADLLTLSGDYGELTTQERERVRTGDLDQIKATKVKTDFTQKYYEALLSFYNKDAAAKLALLKIEEKRTDLDKDQRAKLEEDIKNTEKLMETTSELAKTRAEGFVQTIFDIGKTEATLVRFNREFNTLMSTYKREGMTTSESYTKFIMANVDKFVNYVEEQGKTEISKTKNKTKQLEELYKILGNQQVDITKLTNEEKLALLQAFLNAEEAMIDDSEKRKQERIKETLDTIGKVISEISNRINQSASIVAQSFQNQLDILTYEYNKDMNGIVGETKEANDKRIELEKIYQEEKRKIEKQARITALKFTLAQTIAQGAQAVVNALASAPPPANFILAGIDAALAAAQVAVIQQQINTAQTYMRRGGMLAGGGIASGPSHEQGGIYAGGGSYIEGNEAIINRQSTLAYSGLLSQINMSQGGRPLVVQSPMDSRLVEALAKQKQEPIRAYVVEQDMTKAQSINKRLEQLASF